MPFDSFKVLKPRIDLSVPSVENLIFLLRYWETWPSDFKVWDYTRWNCCAWGLAERMWGGYAADKIAGPIMCLPTDPFTTLTRMKPQNWMSRFFGMSPGQSNRKYVQPHDVADALERYLWDKEGNVGWRHRRDAPDHTSLMVCLLRP